MKEYKLFVQRIGLVGLTNILISISSIILLPILTKNFSVTDYGIWVQFMTTIVLIPNIANLGLPYTMVRFFSAEKDKEKIREGFYSIGFIIFASTVIISILLFLFSESIASLLFNGNVQVATILSVIILFYCLNYFLLNFFRTFQQMKRYSVFSLIQTYLGLSIVSYLALEGFNIEIAAIGLLVSNLVTFFLMIFFIVNNIGFKVPELKNLKEYLSFAIPTIPGNLSYWVVDSSDRYLIGILLGTVFVGYYSPAYALGNMIIMILAPFSFLLPSVLPRYYEENNLSKVNVFMKYSLKYFLLIAIPATFGLSLLSKPILMILTTSEIASNGYFITPFITISALLFGIYGITVNFLILSKKTKFIGTLWSAAAVFNILFNILLIPFLGIIGAAMVTLFTFIITLSLCLLYSAKYFKFDFDLIFILKSIIASISISLIIVFIKPVNIISILIVIIICIAVYFSVMILLKSIKEEEIEFFKNLLY